jgi:Family of unknown function (DUF5677)
MVKRLCKRSEVGHIRPFLAYAKQLIDEKEYYPPFNQYRYLVALALYSKCLTVAEAVLALIEVGFGDEAFGLTRTLIDLNFTLYYISNNNTEERAKLFYEFQIKDRQDLSDVVKIRWPQLLRGLNPLAPSPIANNYPNPHRWSGKSSRDLALEPHSSEVDPATGRPFVHDLDYLVFYRWTSHYVHPTMGALRNHVVEPGREVFVVRRDAGKTLGHMAAFNVTIFVAKAMLGFYRIMGDPQPHRLAKWAKALMTHVGGSHN